MTYSNFVSCYILFLPGPSNGWCLIPEGLLNGTLSHLFGTPWRVQVIYLPRYFNGLKKAGFPGKGNDVELRPLWIRWSVSPTAPQPAICQLFVE